MGHWPHLVTIGPETSKTIANVGSDGSRSYKTVTQFKNEVKTKYKTKNQHDKQILKQLRKGEDESEIQENNEALRKYFHQITEQFMEPLEIFFQTLLPKESDFGHFKSLPKIKPFKEEEFLRKLLKQGIKLKNIEIYRCFIRCVNFVKWFRNKKKRALRDIIKSYIQQFATKRVEDLLTTESGKSIAELYDVVYNQYISFKKKNITY